MSMRERRNPEHYYPEPRPNIPTMSDIDREEQARQHELAEVPDSLVFDVMMGYGGGFIQALAVAGRRADPANLAILKAAWPLYWTKYAEIALPMWKESEGTP